MKKRIELMLSETRETVSGVIPLMVLLILLSGCAGGGKIVVDPEKKSTDGLQGSTVKHFEDGRTGFVISEVADLDAAARRNFELGVEALENEDYEDSLEFFTRVVELSPPISAPHINIAMAYSKIDRPELAEEHLKTALILVSGHPLASHEYGLLLRRTGRFVEAQDVYRQSLMEFPEYHPLRRNLGILCDLYLNDQECALEQYEAYSKSQPEDQQVKLWISELRLRLGR